MTFVLPLTAVVLLFGSTFDLRKYSLTPFQIYNNADVPRYVQTIYINSSKSEYFVVDTSAELRDALGVDVATGLKAMTNNFPYEFRKHLDFSLTGGNYVTIVIRLSIRTVKESLPYNTPTDEEWKTMGPQRVGSHYVQSIVYGADLFALLTILGQSQEQRNNIRQSISSKFDKTGVFDSSFKEKFDAVLKENEVGYSMSSFGHLPTSASTVNSVEQIIALKDKYHQLITKESIGKGFKVQYEMQSLSFLDPAFPDVEKNDCLTKVLEIVELKYEDLVLAYGEYISWVPKSSHRFTPDQEAQIQEFDAALSNAMTAMEVAISKMDITLSGSIFQFQDAFNAYGERRSERKYRDWIHKLKRDISRNWDMP